MNGAELGVVQAAHFTKEEIATVRSKAAPEAALVLYLDFQHMFLRAGCSTGHVTCHG